MHNSRQLSEWCLHFISTNFTAFFKRSDFKLLQDENLRYVREHQWPPVSYLQELEQYEKTITETQKKEGKCCIM